ncbi:hypothetical protein LTR86_002695 [Recurvomyces mirabilis]|nr:hypothetical protein LTR86_002695 [Recurvomyces mirabilis]
MQHQRADAADYVHFDCTGMYNYAAARKAVEKKGHEDSRFLKDESLDMRMQRVCTEPALATKWFKGITHYMPSDKLSDARGHAVCPHGKIFDFDIIMINSGNMEGKDVLTKKPPYDQHGKEKAVNSGGAYEFEDKAVSVHDIEAVARLYPGDAKQQAAAESLVEAGKWEPVVFELPGTFTTTAYPAPTKPPAGL